MNRKNFLKALLGTATLMSMDGFSTMVNAMTHEAHLNNKTSEFATFGAIHLNITNLEKSSHFWTQIVGMKLRKSAEKMAEFGTESKTLVVIHETAKSKFKKGYSGLYHFAIHTPNLAEFANMAHRLNERRYPYSPIDHTMSKSIYLDDPDGINVEFTLETPEEFKRVVTTRGLQIEGTDGVLRSASERLDMNKIMSGLKDRNVDRIIVDETYLGHVHLYANNVVDSNQFYGSIGYQQFNYLPQFMYADVGAGGDYQHRVAMNSWHGQNRPLAPADSAGMRHFQINFKDQDMLKAAVDTVTDCKEDEQGYWMNDPTGNKILLAHIS